MTTGFIVVQLPRYQPRHLLAKFLRSRISANVLGLHRDQWEGVCSSSDRSTPPIVILLDPAHKEFTKARRSVKRLVVLASAAAHPQSLVEAVGDCADKTVVLLVDVNDNSEVENDARVRVRAWLQGHRIDWKYVVVLENSLGC